MKAIGIDYGKRRIGISATDETGLIVKGLTTLDLKSVKDPVKKISDIVSEESPSLVVFGLPLDQNSCDTDMSLIIKKFAEKIKNRTGVAVDFTDESYTSEEADRYLFTQKKKHRREKKNRDRIAACLILESYLKEKNGYTIPDSNPHRES